MILNRENYHSPEAKRKWLSSSDVKQAIKCEFAWKAYRTGQMQEDEGKEAFKQGNLFETMLNGTDEEIRLFQENNSDMFSSRGPTKGQLKSAYQSVMDCVESVRRQPFLMEIIQNSRKQVIMTGKILGVPFRVMCDLIYSDGSVYDLKCMKSFAREWSNRAETFVEWFEAWNYPVQLWIYKEIAEQNGLTVPNVGLIAGSKQNADVQALRFGNDLIAQAKADALYEIERMKEILNGAEPMRCESCEACIKSRVINGFLEV